MLGHAVRQAVIRQYQSDHMMIRLTNWCVLMNGTCVW